MGLRPALDDGLDLGHLHLVPYTLLGLMLAPRLVGDALGDGTTSGGDALARIEFFRLGLFLLPC